MAPPAGAGPLSVAVAEALRPPWIVLGVTTKPVSCKALTGSISRGAVWVVPLAWAVIVAICTVVTVDVVIGNWADAWPAGMVRDNGICTAGLLARSDTGKPVDR